MSKPASSRRCDAWDGKSSGSTNADYSSSLRCGPIVVAGYAYCPLVKSVANCDGTGDEHVESVWYMPTWTLTCLLALTSSEA